MKKVILSTALVLLMLTACNKGIIFNKIDISKIEVIPENNTTPTQVLIITEIEGNGSILYTTYTDGAYWTLDGTEEDVTESGMTHAISRKGGKEAIIDTTIVYYRTPGTYEVRVEIKEGDTYSETFTLL